MKLPNKPPNTICCLASCCPTCCPRHPVTHHAAQHITPLPQNSANHAVQSTQHTAHQVAQRNIMPKMPTNASCCLTSSILLNTTCCNAYRSTQHAANHNIMLTNTTVIQYADRHIIMLYIISLDSTCCTAYHSTQHHAVQHNRHDIQHANQHIIMLYIIPLNST